MKCKNFKDGQKKYWFSFTDPGSFPPELLWHAEIKGGWDREADVCRHKGGWLPATRDTSGITPQSATQMLARFRVWGKVRRALADLFLCPQRSDGHRMNLGVRCEPAIVLRQLFLSGFHFLINDKTVSFTLELQSSLFPALLPCTLGLGTRLHPACTAPG